MATEIQTWQIVDGKLEKIETSLAEEGRTEAYDLESWIESNPSIIGSGLSIIGRQVQTRSGRMDLLGLDGLGNLVIVELKRDKLPREALAQAIDYASDVATWSIEKISEMCSEYIGQSLEDYIAENFSEQNLEIVNINTSQRIVLVGFAIESSLERMINWLSDSYNVDVNAVVLHYVKTSSGDELLTKTAVISEEVAEERAKSKKFKIPMSDEPGTYEEEVLRTILIKYLYRDMYSARRIQKVVIPACLEHGVVTRDQLKQEFVNKGEAEDTTRAGYFISLVSGQMGMKKNDFLRQVIGYAYPTYSWEKDNFFIREDYQHLAREVLQELSEEDEIAEPSATTG
jgi:Holliday junction resolvase-like predicted endonuclease